ncbi:MAG: hypothetical protein JW714_03785 [Candidatus Omnitrophica bacterium]|nr:hypothetical protein [Candidatus Omnitrophota bacterium]
MMKLKDELWLNRILNDCFNQGYQDSDIRKRLKCFKILVGQIIVNLQKQVNQIQRQWQRNPESNEIKEKLISLEKNLLSLKRFCEDKIK